MRKITISYEEKLSFLSSELAIKISQRGFIDIYVDYRTSTRLCYLIIKDVNYDLVYQIPVSYELLDKPFSFIPLDEYVDMFIEERTNTLNELDLKKMRQKWLNSYTGQKSDN